MFLYSRLIAAAAFGVIIITSIANAATPPPTNGQSCPIGTPDQAHTISPGSGSFTDAQGNVFAIDPSSDNTATINGVPITPNGESSQTSQVTIAGGVVYGQDMNTHQWFEMTKGPGGERSWAWQPLASLPSFGQTPVPTSRWDTAQAGTSACSPSATPAAAQASSITPQAMSCTVAGAGSSGVTQAGFTVSQSGFVGPNGPVNLHGVDVDLGAAMQNLPGLLQNFPNMTAIRLVANGNTDTVDNIAPVIQAYTSKGIIVELEDHADSQGGDNTGWYSQMAAAFGNNPNVFLEMPNEPNGSAQQIASNDIDLINAIRATGYKNPIGIQPGGGWDESDVPIVTAALGTAQLYVTPHIYYDGNDPNGAAQYVQSTVQASANLGIPSVVDEFGNAEDGMTINPQGNSVLSAVIAANQAGLIGAMAWSADNGDHPDGSDAICLDVACSQLTSTTGSTIQSWIAGSSGPGAACTPVQQPTGTPQNVAGELPAASGQVQQPVGPLQDGLQMCANQATATTNPELCSALTQAEGLLQQTQSQIGQPQSGSSESASPTTSDVQSQINAATTASQAAAAQAESAANTTGNNQ